MSARVLVVDDIIPNIKLLEARLSAEYFDVISATNGPDALTLCAAGKCDIVLLDVMMPGMDGFEVCRRLKADPTTTHIPVVMITALDQPSDRIKGLQAGADDFLTKPMDEIALLARVRSLARLKNVVDELRQRALTSANLGMSDPLGDALGGGSKSGRILLVDDRPNAHERFAEILTPLHHLDTESEMEEVIQQGSQGQHDLFLISLAIKTFDPLRLCSQIRSLERTRQMPILLLSDMDDRARVLRGLDIGVNDFVTRPVDKNELLARIQTQLRRKLYADSLRQNVKASIEMAVVDALTGLNNRRYLETHLVTLMAKAVERKGPLSLMVLDIDHFKSVNDTYGHDVGDEVLKVFAARIKKVVRSSDLVCRMGGEEFVIVLPNTPGHIAAKAAERARAIIQKDQFPIEGGKRTIPITVSIGLADRGQDTISDVLFKRADKALYRSKQEGRNRVSYDPA